MAETLAPAQRDRIEAARFNMIEQQIRPWLVSDPHVLELLGVVRRERYVPPHLAALAFVDFELPLFIDGTDTGERMLPPRVEARILQELHIQPHESVLEIGAGSGYMTALAAHRAQTVHAIEIDPRLRDFAAANLARNGVINAHVELGDGAQGWAAGAPYDVIIVSASMPVIPDAMRAQLRIGGRLAAFVGRAPAMQAEIVTRTGESAWSTRTLFETVVPALRNAQSPSTFRF